MRRRNIKKNFWFNYKENEQLKYLSNILNLSEASTIRKLLFETQVKESPTKEFYNAIEKINKIGVNINQLTHIANQTGDLYKNELDHNFYILQKLVDDLYDKFL